MQALEEWLEEEERMEKEKDGRRKKRQFTAITLYNAGAYLFLGIVCYISMCIGGKNSKEEVRTLIILFGCCCIFTEFIALLALMPFYKRRNREKRKWAETILDTDEEKMRFLEEIKGSQVQTYEFQEGGYENSIKITPHYLMTCVACWCYIIRWDQVYETRCYKRLFSTPVIAFDDDPRNRMRRVMDQTEKSLYVKKKPHFQKVYEMLQQQPAVKKNLKVYNPFQWRRR